MLEVDVGAWQDAPGRMPQGERAYVIGDVHGRLDLLIPLIKMIEGEVAALRNTSSHNALIFLGDYVDRGPSSREVITLLLALRVPGLEITYLRGNHEAFMLEFMASPLTAMSWPICGGAETMASYGVEAPRIADIEANIHSARKLGRNVPRQHQKFLSRLPFSHWMGNYFFVHAGIRPGVPVADQNGKDLLWIRDPFLDSDADHGAIIVHGHSVSRSAEIRHNRIGIDTGGYASSILTCLTLEGQRLRLAATSPPSRSFTI